VPAVSATATIRAGTRLRMLVSLGFSRARLTSRALIETADACRPARQRGPPTTSRLKINSHKPVSTIAGADCSFNDQPGLLGKRLGQVEPCKRLCERAARATRPSASKTK